MKEDDMENAVRKYREGAQLLSQAVIAQAPLIRAKFNALVKEGFSEAQAIELCKGNILQ